MNKTEKLKTEYYSTKQLKNDLKLPVKTIKLLNPPDLKQRSFHTGFWSYHYLKSRVDNYVKEQNTFKILKDLAESENLTINKN